MRRVVRLAVLAAGTFTALLVVPSAIADKPILKVEDMVVEATGPNGAKVVYAISAEDDNGPPKVTCSPPDGGTLPLGKTQVTCTAVDTKTGQSATKSFQVTVTDTTAPTLTVPSSVTAEATGASGAQVTYSGVSATDLVSGTLTPTCAKASGSTFPIGTTTVQCTATDGAGNKGSATFSVSVVDTKPPLVTVPSDIGGVEATGPAGATVTYTGVSATDLVSGTLTPACNRLSGSTFPVGRTTVTCSATDAAGNKGSASFAITVVDTKGPTITVPGGITAEATGPSGASVSYTVTANDLVSGSLTPSCDKPSGATFPVGKTTVVCNATDAAGNKGSASFAITVEDTKAPTITVPSGVTAEATGPSGAAVSYTVTATDLVSGALTPSCDRPSGSVFPLGATTVKCEATDSSRNRTSASFIVTVKDTTPPAFTNLPADIKAEATGPSGSSVGYGRPTAVDAVDGAVSSSCSPSSGATYPVGSTRVTCRATDSRGNSGTAWFSITVVDTTPPVLTVPAPVTVSSQGGEGAAASLAGIAAFLNGASARDIVDGAVSVSHDAPAVFAVGTTTVIFRASDSAGNAVTARSTVTVTKEAVTPSKPLDRTPPDDIRGLRAKSGDRAVVLSWQRPRADDFDHVVITRSTRSSTEKPVYTGPSLGYVDRNLTNGADYRYVVISYDRAGNRAAGVAIVTAPKAVMLTSPPDGVRVTRPPLLRWRPVAGADYYNVQLFRGRTKMLTIWPVKTAFQLQSSWPYSGHREHLAPGLYRWYVFPGYGPRSANKYGAVLGPSTFALVKGN